MPSKSRQEVEGGTHHVCARGAQKLLVFRTPEDRLLYVQLLVRTIEKYGWRVIAVCLMPNHIHIVVLTPLPNLGAGMRFLHGRYGQLFRERHGESGCGHVFQGPFESAPARSEGWVWRDIAYVALNPVKHDFCARPEEWEWNTHTAIVQDQTPGWLDTKLLFSLFEIDGGDGRANYLKFIENQLANLKNGH